MTITAAQLQTLIITQCGGDTKDGTLAANMPLIWDMYEGDGAGRPLMQFLFAKRDALLTLIGYYQNSVDYRSGDQMVYKHQRVVALTNILNLVTSEINARVKKYNSLRGGAFKTISRTSPILPADLPDTVFSPDPSARVYRGDALLPPFTVDRR